jgi:putative peptidoglycan lipid II flippase
VILAPLLLRLFVDSAYFTDPALSAEKESMISFARWCLPQIFFYGMFVLVGQILNARNRFGPMMWAPIANNIVSIGVITLYLILFADKPANGGYTTAQEVLLGLGSTIGIAVQLLVLLPYLRATGFRISPRFDFLHTGLGHTMKLGAWTVGFVIVNQLAFYVMVHRATAGSAQVVNGASDASGYTVYANAFLLTQVPHSIVTVSLVTATMTLVSGLAADGLLSRVAEETRNTLQLVLSVIVPFAIALLVLGPALATVLFSWGAAAGDTTTLGWTLMAFAPGMIMFGVHYTILRGFYALEDTRTPFFIQCVISAVNIALAISLTDVVTPAFVAPALALAYGAAYTVGALVSIGVLTGRIGGLASWSLVGFAGRVLVAAAAAAGLAWATVAGLEQAGLEVASKLDSLVLLLAGGVVGLLVYVVAARLLRISEISRIVQVVVSRGKRG